MLTSSVDVGLCAKENLSNLFISVVSIDKSLSVRNDEACSPSSKYEQRFQIGFMYRRLARSITNSLLTPTEVDAPKPALVKCESIRVESHVTGISTAMRRTMPFV